MDATDPLVASTTVQNAANAATPQTPDLTGVDINPPTPAELAAQKAAIDKKNAEILGLDPMVFWAIVAVATLGVGGLIYYFTRPKKNRGGRKPKAD